MKTSRLLLVSLLAVVVPVDAWGGSSGGSAQGEGPATYAGSPSAAGPANTCLAWDTNPTACGSNLFATDQNADGSLVCTQPSFADLSSTIAITQIADNLITPAKTDFTADNTTANATTTHHGLLPKLDSSASKYLDGSGAWSTPAGGISGLGSVDNRLLRSDGTAGTAAQNSTLGLTDAGRLSIPADDGSGAAGSTTANTICFRGGLSVYCIYSDGSSLLIENDSGVIWKFTGANIQVPSTGGFRPGADATVEYARDAAGVAKIHNPADGVRELFVYGGSCVVASDQTNATTTPQTLACYNVTSGTAAIALKAGRSYAGSCEIFLSDSVSADGAAIDFDAGTATATTFRQDTTAKDTAGVVVAASTQTTALATDVATATWTGDGIFHSTIFIKVNAAGTFQPRFMQVAHTTGTLTAAAGSHCLLTDVTP